MNKALLAAGLGGLLAIGATGFVMSGEGASSAGAQIASDRPTGERFGLSSSLPIYRAPQASVADALAQGETKPHWLRAAVEARNSLVPIDVIDANSLSQIDTLLLIQPRALTPAEFVALDTWVREGGRVLLIADPMLVGEPPFAMGDPRNPQAISVTGPIEARWGLELQSGKFGDGAERSVSLGGHDMPVSLGGTFAKRPPAGENPDNSADCELRSGGLMAVCAIGEGHAVLVADATVFEDPVGSDQAADIFWSLIGILGDESPR
ncbi:hypothetical protein [Citromicrobium bathyomarinum]|uniref:hypothetical protein n=1 Tax=Citromicrobium bathyomarinum TaxID=72174 RepID=UPI00315A032A